jgi:hypothetical protein
MQNERVAAAVSLRKRYALDRDSLIARRPDADEGNAFGLCEKHQPLPLAQAQLVNLRETIAGMSGRWRKRPVSGSRSHTSVTCVPPPWYAGSENPSASNLPLASTAASSVPPKAQRTRRGVAPEDLLEPERELVAETIAHGRTDREHEHSRDDKHDRERAAGDAAGTRPAALFPVPVSTLDPHCPAARYIGDL